jgi:hypothetical protein
VSYGLRHPDVPADDQVDVVALTWYVRRADRPPDLAARWLALCTEHLPAAQPQRFGATEPPPHRFAELGPAGFAAVWTSPPTS